MTTSATGGYLKPGYTQEPPRGLTLTQFIQTVLVGVSTLPGELVRPGWQVEPPKNPDIGVNWMAFWVTQSTPDAYAYSGTNPDGSNNFQRQEELEIQCSFYGPYALDYMALVRDGFQITQNLEGPKLANMNFTQVGVATHSPDLVHERWIDRYVMSVFLRRAIQRVYPILTILSVEGTVHTVVGNEPYLLEFKTPA